MALTRGLAAALLIAGMGVGTGDAQNPPPPVAGAGTAADTIRWTGTASQGGLILGTAPVGTATLMLDGVAIPFAPDGRFVVGFDRDARATATLAAARADGGTVTQDIAIAARAWNISRLPTLPKYPLPAPAFAAIRPGELVRIATARAIDTGATGWRQAFVWPVTGRISTPFGAQRIYANGEAGAFHSGVDVARPAGTPVVAPADGIVILAATSPFTLEGHLLMIDHGMGLNSAFLHLSRIDVRVGDRVQQGESVGAVGMSGRATGPHLHWSLRWRDTRLDPMLAAGNMNAR